MKKFKLQCNKHDDSLFKDVCFLESNATQHFLDIQTFKTFLYFCNIFYFFFIFLLNGWEGIKLVYLTVPKNTNIQL